MFYKKNNVLQVFLFALAMLSLPFCSATATVTVTTATGGSAISADTAGGTYASLTGPVITEGATGDIGVGTIILNAPSGFNFDTTANSVTATRTNAGGNCGGSASLQLSGKTSQKVTPTTTTITVTVSRATSSTCRAIITWTGIKLRPTAGTPLASGNILKTGTSTISGITGTTSLGAIAEVAGAKTKLAFTMQPSPTANTNVDFTVKPIIAVQDQFGNTVASDNASTINYTVVISTAICGGTRGSGTLTSTPASGAAVTAGLLTYTAMKYSTGEDIKICAASTGITSVLSNTIAVSNPVPTTTSILPISKTIGDAGFDLTVNGTNFISSSVANFAGSPRATHYVSANQLTATILASDLTTLGTFDITVTNPTPGGGTSNAQSFSVNPPPASKFVIIDPTDNTVDNPITVTIQAQRPDNSVDTAYQNDVTLNASGSATGSGLVDIINGVGTINISDRAVETVNLSLTDSQTTGLDVSSTQQVGFSPGIAAIYSLNNVVSFVAGQMAAYTVTRTDQYGNSVTNGSSIVYLYSSSITPNKKFYDAVTGGNIITSITIPDGQSAINFWYYDETPDTYTITASDNSSAPDGNDNINDAVDSVIVVAGPTNQFILNDPGDVYISTRLGYTVTRKDAFNNLATSGTNTVYLYSSSVTGIFYDADTAGNTITSIDIVDGNSTTNFWYSDDTPNTYTITASDSTPIANGNTGIVDATDSVIISSVPIVATKFIIIDPTDGTVDAPIAVTVKAVDDLGNVDTTFQSDVTLNASGSATGAGIVNIVNGVGIINISNTAVETVNLSLTDSQTTGLNVDSTQNVIFAVGAVKQFSLDNPGDMSAGSRIGYSVTRKDRYGNIVTSGLTPVYLYGLPTEITKKFYDADTGGSEINFVNITNGNSTASFWYYDENTGTTSVVVSDNNTAPDGAAGIADVSDTVLVSAGAVAKFILNDPGDMTAKTRLGYTVSRQDLFGNTVTSGVSLVYLYSSSTGMNTSFYDNGSGGLVINSIPIDDTKSMANFWYYDETAGNYTITASDSSPTPNGSTGIADAADSVAVSNIPITATKFVIVDPADSMINTAVTVTVRAEDADGNVDTTYQNDVTLNLTGSAAGAGLVNIVNGVGTLPINDSVAETVILSLTDTESTGLSVSSTQQITFSTTPPVFVSTGVIGAPVAKVSKISFSGRAYPEAKLSIIAVKEGEPTIEKESVSSSNGNFEIVFDGLASGSAAYALLVQDKDGRTAQTKIYNLNLLNSSSELDINDILVSPTIGFSRSTITKGDFLAIIGYATPKSKVVIEVDGQEIATSVVAGADGSYKYLYNTALLGLGSHTIRASQTTSDGVQSEFSPQKVFFTTNLAVPKTDFNNDGKLNITDWSIFLSHWFSADSATRLLDDLNGDGKLNATDFSIFIRTLRQ